MLRSLSDFTADIDKPNDVLTNINEIEQFICEKDAAALNSPGKSGEKALYIAVRRRHIKIIDQLLAKPNIDVNVCDADGNTALMLAVQTADTTIVDKLLESPTIEIAKSNTRNETALSIALHNNFYNNAACILKKCWRTHSVSMLKSIDKNQIDLEKLFYSISEKFKSEFVTELLENKNKVLTTLFMNDENKSSKVCFEKINNIYVDILRNRLKIINEDDLQSDDVVNIKRFVDYKVLTNSSDNNSSLEPRIAKMMVYWLCDRDSSKLSPDNIEYLKPFKKDLVAAIEQMPRVNQEWYFGMIFNDKNSDSSNRDTALGKLFWSGRVDMNDTSTGLGQARVAHQRLKGIKVQTDNLTNFFKVRIPRGFGRLFNLDSTSTNEETSGCSPKI